MRGRTLGVLPSYDIISKSIPGVVFLLLLVSLVPSKYDFEAISFGDSLADYALIFIALLLLALFIGEGIHIVAVFIEKTILFVARVIQRTSYWVWFLIQRAAGIEVDLKRQLGRFRRWEEDRSTNVSGVVHGWIARRYWGLDDTFKNHRVLFAHSLMWHFGETKERDQSIGYRWGESGKGEPYDCFDESIKRSIGVDIIKLEADESKFEAELKELYTLVKTTVAANEIGQSSRYQAIYSFCRSMYVVSLFAALSYGLITFPTVPEQLGLGGTLQFLGISPPVRPNATWYEPLAFQYLSENTNTTVVLPAVSTFVFMIGTGRYKRHFVDYLVAEYCVLVTSPTDSADDEATDADRSEK